LKIYPKKYPIFGIIGLANEEPFASEIDDELQFPSIPAPQTNPPQPPNNQHGAGIKNQHTGA
jgi:hypothetical protein